MTRFMENLQAQVLVLSEQERDFLDKYGDWLESLESGEILPITEKQVQFIAVLRGERTPQNNNELLWLRVKASRESYRILEQAESERDRLKNQLISKNGIIDRLYSDIHWLRVEIDRQNGLITKLQRIADKYEPIQAETESIPPKKSTHDICRQCGGNGGAGGRCPRCHGNGFEP